jgi:hypothetical protein
MTKSRLAREGLEKALYKQTPVSAVSCYDLARDLAGTLKGLREDLADDPKLDIQEEQADLRALMHRYPNRPMSLADACLVRLSDMQPEKSSRWMPD